MGIISNILGGMGLYQMGCQIWNAFMDITLGFLVKTPEEVDSTLWSLIMNNIYPIFLAIGAACVTIFFFLGIYRDITDFRQIADVERLTYVYLRLAFCQAVILALQPFIIGMFRSGQALSNLIITNMGFEPGEGYGHLDAYSTFFANGDTLYTAGLILGILFLVAALICGAVICFSVYARIFKMIFAVPTGALAVATIAGGGGISRMAEGWLKEFIAVLLEAPFMILGLGIAVPFMNVNLFPDAGTASSLMSVIEPAFKMILVAGALKGCSMIFRRYLSIN